MTRQELIKAAQIRCQHARDELEKFKKNLKLNPVYAFEWADGAIDAAAALSVYETVIQVLTYKPKDETLPRPDAKMMVESLRRDMEDNVRMALTHGLSTGQGKNLMARAKAAAWYNFGHEAIGRSFLEEIEAMDDDE